ncbi:hypothetical protein AQUCO_01200227v1 [Aquilegia coerulea]|uniref:Cytochrome P450 n=1 Tax=Aquilegia coerulea TaxID=218851 RepID=A0A2G5E4W6_AQUCA|nr:hypothetical protein AQUCO_01200227v1 [Aquilegia coerulea]
MELAWLIWSSICLLVVSLIQFFRGKTRNVSYGQLPPGPRGWPLVGNLFDLGEVPHQNLLDLGRKYGPVLWLQFGAMNNVIIQSSKAATEMFKNHDLTYSGRTITDAMTACKYHEGSLAVAQYGPYWRTVKRLCITALTINKRVNETISLRRKGIDKMIQWIDEEAKNQGGVQVGHFVFLMNFNLLGNLMLSRDLIDPQSAEGPEFYDAMDNLMKAAGQPNVADFFPFLKWLDPQGVRKKMEDAVGQGIHIVTGFLKERIEDQKSGEQNKRKDFLDVLLEYEGEGEGPCKISERDLVILILEMFLAGTETTSSTTEWAMTELLRSPEKMNTLCKELEDVVGHNRKIEESDIEELHYLRAVVKETLRLHPPLPFLLPRRAVKDNNFMGYHIPKDTQILVNVWAIGRDPDSWDDPLSFKPERFIGSDIDYQGQHFQLIPFGAGRRICAGVPLANRVLHLALGSLLHCFDWKLDSSVSPDSIDMKERMGITLRKEVPLKAFAKKRNVHYGIN